MFEPVTLALLLMIPVKADADVACTTIEAEAPGLNDPIVHTRTLEGCTGEHAPARQTFEQLDVQATLVKVEGKVSRRTSELAGLILVFVTVKVYEVVPPAHMVLGFGVFVTVTVAPHNCKAYARRPEARFAKLDSNA
jgi:hypothetical protein